MLFCSCAPGWAAEPVIYGIDGDTFVVGTEHIRILGMDTPETYGPRCPDEAARGYQAAGRLQHLLHTRKVTIQRSAAKDKYQRTLATVLVGSDNVAKLMIAEGLARPYNGGKRQPWCPGKKARPALY